MGSLLAERFAESLRKSRGQEAQDAEQMTFTPPDAPALPDIPLEEKEEKEELKLDQAVEDSFIGVKGTIASTLAPKISPPKEKSLSHRFLESMKGEKITSPTLLVEPQEALKANKVPRKLSERFADTLNTPMVTMVGQEPKTGDEGLYSKVDRAVTKGVKAVGESYPAQALFGLAKDAASSELGQTAIDYGKQAVNSKVGKGFIGFGKKVLTVLSAEEHGEVMALYKMYGSPEKEDFSEYTWSNHLIEHLGYPDSVLTHAYGFALGLTASPSFYYTGGLSGIAKALLKFGRAPLTKGGMKAVNALIKKEAKDEIEKATLKAGGEISEQASNSIIQKIEKQVHEEVLQKYSLISGDLSSAKLSKDVSHLPHSIFDQGGINIKLPFSGNKYNLVKGTTIAQTIRDLKLDQVTHYLTEKGLGKVAQGARAVGKAITQSRPYQDLQEHPFVKDLNKLRKMVAGVVIPNYGKPKEFLDLWEEMHMIRAVKAHKVERIVERFLKGMNKTQREEFYDVSIRASNMPERIIVSELATDAVVKERLDRFYGQGKHEGKSSISGLMAKWSPMLEEERPNWMAGIIKDLHLRNVRLDADLLEGKFVSKRLPGQSHKYTTDPGQALSVRLGQIAYAKLMQDTYEKAIKQKMGGMLNLGQYQGLEPAARAEYRIFRSPFHKHLIGDVSLKERFKEPVIFAKKEFVEAFDQAFQRTNMSIPFLTAYTNLFKKGSYLGFAASLARNWRSNIFYNSESIGFRATLNPAMRGKVRRALKGQGLDDKIVAETGETFTMRNLINEARVHEVAREGDLFFDLTGEGIKDRHAKDLYEFVFQRLNPLSNNFMVYTAGAKANNAIENQARFLNYVSWRAKGATPKMAAMEAKEALLDYMKLAKDPFQRDFLGSMILFYPFHRLNLEHQIKALVHRPAQREALVRAMREFGPSDEDWNKLPPHYKNKMGLKIAEMIVIGSGHPFEDFIDDIPGSFDDFFAKVTPGVRYPLELIAGRDFHSGREITNLRSANEFKFVFSFLRKPWVPAPIKEALDSIRKQMGLMELPNGKVEADPYLMHASKNLITARYQSTLGLLQNEEKTLVRKIFQLSLGILPLDPEQEKRMASLIAKERVGKDINQHAKRKGLGFTIRDIEARDKQFQPYFNDYNTRMRYYNNPEIIYKVGDHFRSILDHMHEKKMEIRE